MLTTRSAEVPNLDARLIEIGDDDGLAERVREVRHGRDGVTAAVPRAVPIEPRAGPIEHDREVLPRQGVRPRGAAADVERARRAVEIARRLLRRRVRRLRSALDDLADLVARDGGVPIVTVPAHGEAALDAHVERRREG